MTADTVNLGRVSIHPDALAAYAINVTKITNERVPNSGDAVRRGIASVVIESPPGHEALVHSVAIPAAKNPQRH